MATDEELVEKLKEFLRSSDLSTTTTGAVRRYLEAEFDADLSHKKAFIREQVDLFLSSEMKNENEEGEGEGKGKEEDEGEGEEEEEEEEEEMEGSSNGAGKKKRRMSKCNNNKEEKKRGGGFTKVCSLSEQLQNFVGETTLARTEVVKKIWAYIKANDLQDPKNKRKILCDETLKTLFNVNSIDMFQMNKALTKHIWPLEDGDNNNGGGGSSKSKEKEKPQKKEKQNDGSAKKQKTGQTGQSGLLIPLKISEELKTFLGTGESSLARSDLIKRMWAYFKENNLQDPADRRNIVCDDKLKELFKVDSFNGFSVAKLLTPHFIKD